MKLKNIAKLILEEASGNISLKDIKYDNGNLPWKVSVGSVIHTDKGMPFPNGHNAIHQFKENLPDDYIPRNGSKSFEAWKILEYFKATAEILKDPIPKDFYAGIEYGITNFPESIKSITPNPGDELALLRDKTTVWLVEKGPVKTEWSAVPGLKSESATVIWNQSVYVGDHNLQWLARISNSQGQDIKEVYKITDADRIVTELILAGNYTMMGGGTNEVWFKKTIDKIKGKEMVKVINTTLRRLLTSFNASKWGPEDIYFLRNGKVIRKRDYHTELMPYPGSVNKGDPIANAFLTDQDIRNKADDKFDGLAKYIVGEFDAGTDRDEILNMLIKNKAAKYEPISNRCYIPYKVGTSWGIDYAADQETLRYLPKNQIFIIATAEEAADDTTGAKPPWAN